MGDYDTTSYKGNFIRFFAFVATDVERVTRVKHKTCIFALITDVIIYCHRLYGQLEWRTVFLFGCFWSYFCNFSVVLFRLFPCLGFLAWMRAGILLTGTLGFHFLLTISTCLPFVGFQVCHLQAA